MQKRIIALVWALLLCASPLLNAAEKDHLDVFTMTEIPAGTYDVQLEDSGKTVTVQMEINGDRAKFVRSSLPKFEASRFSSKEIIPSM